MNAVPPRCSFHPQGAQCIAALAYLQTDGIPGTWTDWKPFTLTGV